MQFILLIVSLLISGCSYNNPAQIAVTDKQLTLPPNFTMQADVNYKIPHSAIKYNINNAHIVSENSNHWIVIESQTIEKVVPLLNSYINQIGYVLRYSESGVIQTEWKEVDNKTPQGASLRGLFDWLKIGSSSLTSMEMYRVLLWQQNKNVLLIAGNSQMDEVYEGCINQKSSQTSSFASSDSQRTRWISHPSNGVSELEFLVNFMKFLGVNESSVYIPNSTIIINNELIIKKSDNVWLKIASAIEHSGFVIVKQDENNKTFYVKQIAQDSLVHNEKTYQIKVNISDNVKISFIDYKNSEDALKKIQSNISE